MTPDRLWNLLSRRGTLKDQMQVFFSGSGSVVWDWKCPLNFRTFPDFCCRAIAALIAIPAVHCVDDVIVIEVVELFSSPCMCWRKFAELCGWDVPDEKPPPPSQVFWALGPLLDFPMYPKEPMMIRPVEERMSSSQITLGKFLVERRLNPSLTGELYGKLMFVSCLYFGRLGRALLRAFSRRQHKSIHMLNNQIEASVRFWLDNMESLRPREIPVSLSSMPCFLWYSDGEGEGAGVVIAMWRPCGRVVGGYLKLWSEVRDSWFRMESAGGHYDIFEIEAVGPALILHNWIHLLTPGAL